MTYISDYDIIVGIMKTNAPSEIRLEITKKNYERAVRASSGSCLVADAIKEQHPRFSHVSVDVATIRLTDRECGERYIYLTPAAVYETLLFFDQGWPEEKLPKKLRVRTLVKITPITKSASSLRIEAEERKVRLAELEAKEKSHKSLTNVERRTMEKLRKRVKTNPKSRPLTYGPHKHEKIGNDIVILGGKPPKHHKHNPNLLHGYDRHFGAKKAKPNVVLQKVIDDAVEKAVAEERAKNN